MGSIACTFSPNYELLIASRMLQGATAGVGVAQFGGDLPLLAGHQGNVVVFPDDGENLVALHALVNFQVDKEGETLAWVFERHVRDLFFALALVAVGDSQFDFG